MKQPPPHTVYQLNVRNVQASERYVFLCDCPASVWLSPQAVSTCSIFYTNNCAMLRLPSFCRIFQPFRLSTDKHETTRSRVFVCTQLYHHTIALQTASLCPFHKTDSMGLWRMLSIYMYRQQCSAVSQSVSTHSVHSRTEQKAEFVSSSMFICSSLYVARTWIVFASHECYNECTLWFHARARKRQCVRLCYAWITTFDCDCALGSLSAEWC